MSPTLTVLLTAAGGVLIAAVAALVVLGAALARSRRDLRNAHWLLHHDPLTGLASRQGALAHLDRARRERRRHAVVLLDLDRFKAVNDTLGHAAGDAALRQVAQRLAALPPPVRLAARLHGDEFLLVVDGDTATVRAAADAAWRALADAPVLVGGHVIDLSASVGVATADPATGSDDLLACADLAMYRAKTTATGVHLHTPTRHRPPAGGQQHLRRQYRDRRRAVTGDPTPSPTRQRIPTVPTDLYFDLASALRLAEHAVTAPRHEPSYAEHHDGRSCPGALVWVADDGTYLMSNGNPPLLNDPDDPTSNIVVHAHAFGPGSDRHLLGLTDVGFDDFAEHLHLTGGDPPLIDLLRDAAHDGYRWLVLRVDGDTVTTRVHRTDPPDPGI